MAERSRLPRWLRRILLGFLAAALGVGAAAGLYQVSVEPGAAIVKAVFEAKPEVSPPSDFAAINSEVSQLPTVAIRAKDAPVAHLQLFAPRAESSTARPVILWIHGGGFISSSADTVHDYVEMLSAKGYLVANLDYSLAPGARYPVPVEQANAALAYLTAHAAAAGGDPTRIYIGGDSAGAQIASQLGSVETNPALASAMHLTPGVSTSSLRGVVLFCGLYDMRTVGSTGFPALRSYLWAYTGSRTWTDYADIDQLSTTSTATANYPPTFITVGDVDPFSSQAGELASRLRQRGVDVTTLFWNGTHDGLSHEYQFNFALPQATTAFNDTLTFLGNHGGSK